MTMQTDSTPSSSPDHQPKPCCAAVRDGKRYSIPAIAFHWIMAIAVGTVIGLALYMDGLENGTHKYQVYALHKSFGLLVLALVIPRIIWRFATPHPGKMPTHKRWERTLSSIVAWALYALMFAMPLSGLIMNGAAGYQVKFFDLFTIDPLVAKNADLAKSLKEAHEIMGDAIQILILLHVGGALKHLFIDRDNTLYRMAPLKWLRLKD